MVVACGPFTSDSDLEYAAFSNLLNRISSSKPSVITLVSQSTSMSCNPIDSTIARTFR